MQFGEKGLEAVNHYANVLAKSHGFTGKLNVVSEEPRAFKVGEKQFYEGGHYDPADSSITLNKRNLQLDSYAGIVAHETMHDKWHVIDDERKREHDEISQRIKAYPEWFDRTFLPSGEPRTKEARAYLEKEYPVSSLFGRTIGDGVVELGGGFEAAKWEDGVSNYSDAYWSPEALRQNYSISSAENETLAEIARLDQSGELHPEPIMSPFDELGKMGYEVKHNANGRAYLRKNFDTVKPRKNSKAYNLLEQIKSPRLVKMKDGKVQIFKRWMDLYKGINEHYARLKSKSIATDTKV